MLFSYKARLKTGEVVEGIMDMPDRFAISRELRSRGSTPISIQEKKPRFDFMESLNSLFSRVNTGELIILTKNLGGMLAAGLSLHRALSVLQKQTKNVYLNKVLVSIGDDINSGETFSTALAKFPDVFSKLFVSMSSAGEESGNLSNALADIGVNLDKSYSLNQKIRGALIYPGVIFSAMIVIGILMFAFVVPTLAGTFKELGVTLPKSTQAIILFGDFFSNNLLLTFLLLFAFIFGILLLVRAKFAQPYIDFIILRIPVIGNLAKELNTARTTRTLSSLLVSGVSITRAVEITEDVVQNLYYKKVLAQARVAVEKGSPFSQVFQENVKLYPVMMSEMIEVGEETGKLSEMLLNVAIFYEAEIENKTKNLSVIIEPVLMVIIGAAVGFFAISMISPLYSILNNIS